MHLTREFLDLEKNIDYSHRIKERKGDYNET